MKILIVTPYFMEPRRWVASSYKAAFALARPDRKVVVFTGGSRDEPREEQLTPDLKVFRFPDVFLPDPVNFGILPFLSLRLLSVWRRERPTHVLVYKHMFYTSLSVFWLKLFRRPVVLVTDTFPGIVWFSRSRLVNAVLWVYARTIGLLILKLADRVVLLHQGLAETAGSLGLHRVTVVHNGVDLDLFPIREPSPPRNEVVITYIGRLESVKGVEVLLDVARDLSRTRAHVTFLLAGDTAGAEELTSRHGSDRLQFLGYRTDVPAILSKTDIFVLPSYAEGLPNALMEAMAAGCACVASRVGGVIELLGDDEAGLTVPPGDRPALLAAIERLVADAELRSRLGARARGVIEERYRLEQTAEKLCAILREAGTG